MNDPIVVFDLGGVMVRVASTWTEALDWGRVVPGNAEAAAMPLASCPDFEPYQANQVTLDEYLETLRRHLGLRDREEALLTHRSILMEPYPDTVPLVEELHAKGVRTACLSNTNATHWDVMGDPSLYPAIAALQIHVLSHEVHVDKPNEAIYRAFEKIAGVAPSQCVFFDDNLPNVEAANRFGWNAHRIDPHGQPASQVRSVLARLAIL